MKVFFSVEDLGKILRPSPKITVLVHDDWTCYDVENKERFSDAVDAKSASTQIDDMKVEKGVSLRLVVWVADLVNLG